METLSVSISTKCGIVLLGLLFFLLTNQIVQTDAVKIFPEVQGYEQVVEEGSTLTLTCIGQLSDPNQVIKLKWVIPKFTRNQQKVVKYFKITFICRHTTSFSFPNVREPNNVSTKQLLGMARTSFQF